jgi:dTDP-4-dehydrorhamnose reductase
MKKILIVGVSGLIGANLARYLRRRYQVYGTFSRLPPRVSDVPCVKLRVEPRAPVEILCRRLRPDVVLYCAGVADEKRCRQDPMGTLFLNADGPALFAESISRWGGRLFYFSTSKVYSGERGDYREEEAVSPQTSYGRAKVRGEEMLARYSQALVLRLGNVFGWAGAGQISFLRRLLLELWQDREVPLICDEYRNFLGVDQLSFAVERLIENGLEGGPYHLSDGSKTTFYGFSREVAKVFRIPTTLLRPVTGEEFSRQTGSLMNRGRDLSLDGSELSRATEIVPGPFAASLRTLHHELASGRQ